MDETQNYSFGAHASSFLSRCTRIGTLASLRGGGADCATLLNGSGYSSGGEQCQHSYKLTGCALVQSLRDPPSTTLPSVATRSTHPRKLGPCTKSVWWWSWPRAVMFARGSLSHVREVVGCRPCEVGLQESRLLSLAGPAGSDDDRASPTRGDHPRLLRNRHRPVQRPPHHRPAQHARSDLTHRSVNRPTTTSPIPIR